MHNIIVHRAPFLYTETNNKENISSNHSMSSMLSMSMYVLNAMVDFMR